MYISKFVSEPVSISMTDTAIPIELYTKLTLVTLFLNLTTKLL